MISDKGLAPIQECQFSRLKSGLRTLKEIKVDVIDWLPHGHLRQECGSKGQTRVGETIPGKFLGLNQAQSGPIVARNQEKCF